MVSIRNLIAGLALVSASAFAAPLETRAVDPTCLLNPAVVTALTCIVGCLGTIASNPTGVGACALECVRGLTNAEIVRRSIFQQDSPPCNDANANYLCRLALRGYLQPFQVPEFSHLFRAVVVSEPVLTRRR
jgi:hypothetical protein